MRYLNPEIKPYIRPKPLIKKPHPYKCEEGEEYEFCFLEKVPIKSKNKTKPKKYKMVKKCETIKQKCGGSKMKFCEECGYLM